MVCSLFEIAHETSSPSGLIGLSCHSSRSQVSPLLGGVPWAPSPLSLVSLTFVLQESPPLLPIIHPGHVGHPRRQVNRMRLVLGRYTESEDPTSNRFHQTAQARPLQPKVSSFDPSWNAECLGHYAKSYLYSGTLSKVTSSCPGGAAPCSCVRL